MVQATLPSDRADRLFKALADPTRREILSLLRGGRLSVGDIARNFHTSRPAVSKHLRLLREARLVVDSKHGTTSLYALNAGPLQAVDTWLEHYRVFWRRNLQQLKEHVEHTHD